MRCSTRFHLERVEAAAAAASAAGWSAVGLALTTDESADDIDHRAITGLLGHAEIVPRCALVDASLTVCTSDEVEMESGAIIYYRLLDRGNERGIVSVATDPTGAWRAALWLPEGFVLADPVDPTPAPPRQPSAGSDVDVMCQMPSSVDYLPMGPGATGPYVQNLQQVLARLGFDVGSSGADGSYGPSTEAAVRAWQAATPDLRVTGVMCWEDWLAITAASESEYVEE